MPDPAAHISCGAQNICAPERNEDGIQEVPFPHEFTKEHVSSPPLHILKAQRQAHIAVLRDLKRCPSLELSDTEPRRKHKESRLKWKDRCRRLAAWLRALASNKRTFDETFQRTIALEVPNDKGDYTLRYGTALIDTGSDCNMMSRRFAEILFGKLNSTNSHQLVRSPLGEEIYNEIGQAELRWQLLVDPAIINPLVRRHDKFDLSLFHIMEHGTEIDLIIGRPDILNFKLLNAKSRIPFAAPFRSLPSSNDHQTVVDDEARAALVRKQEREQRIRETASRKQREAYAQTQASKHAQETTACSGV